VLSANGVEMTVPKPTSAAKETILAMAFSDAGSSDDDDEEWEEGSEEQQQEGIDADDSMDTTSGAAVAASHISTDTAASAAAHAAAVASPSAAESDDADEPIDGVSPSPSSEEGTVAPPDTLTVVSAFTMMGADGKGVRGMGNFSGANSVNDVMNCIPRVVRRMFELDG